MVTKYGILANTHSNPEDVDLALRALTEQGVDALLVSGDVGDTARHIAYTFEQVGKTGLPACVFPGGAESFRDFEGASAFFSERNKRLINPFTDPKIDMGDHHVIVLPGSTSPGKGGYLLDDPADKESGVYKVNKGRGRARLVNMRDLDDLVTRPKRTIVVSHEPRRCSDLRHGIDVASFAEGPDGGIVSRKLFEAQLAAKLGKGLTSSQIKEIAERAGHKLKIANRGSRRLKAALERLGVTKTVGTKYHESVGRAHDNGYNPIDEGEFTESLHWQPACLDDGFAGILTVNRGQVAYQNVPIRGYSGTGAVNDLLDEVGSPSATISRPEEILVDSQTEDLFRNQ